MFHQIIKKGVMTISNHFLKKFISKSLFQHLSTVHHFLLAHESRIKHEQNKTQLNLWLKNVEKDQRIGILWQKREEKVLTVSKMAEGSRGTESRRETWEQSDSYRNRYYNCTTEKVKTLSTETFLIVSMKHLTRPQRSADPDDLFTNSLIIPLNS